MSEKTLTEAEINAFFDDIDTDRDGRITFAELEARLDAVYHELNPPPIQHTHFSHDPEKQHQQQTQDDEQERHDLHDFLVALMPDCSSALTRAQFAEQVNKLGIPSQDQTSSEEQDSSDHALEQAIPFQRRLRAHWHVHGARVLWIAFVTALVLAFGIWQMVTYIKNQPVRAALGWGIILSKASAGALYPSLFFVVLSMSRHLATFLRRSYLLSRFVNWDRSQSFHIQMSILSLALSTLHAIGHLTGTFLYGSRPAQQDNLIAILGTQKSYRDFVASRPGWSGIVALGCFYIIALLSMPAIRTRSYELFQIGHLLMFLMIAMLCLHGTAQLLQHPMLGYWLVFPTLVILAERMWRVFVRGLLHRFKARMEILDDDTVALTIKHRPNGAPWPYQAGQYILLQVPTLSTFQWHPFTISQCRDDLLQVHIKTDGNWTSALRDLPEGQDILVGVDGPFGAPAQRFYHYDYALVIGSGIGITPFSAILTDIEQHASEKRDPWQERSNPVSRNLSRVASRVLSRTSTRSTPQPGTQPDSTRATLVSASQLLKEKAGSRKPQQQHQGIEQEQAATDESSRAITGPRRRVDFHWMVREKNHLLWFSDLLNRAVDLSASAKQHLDLRINTHITARRRNISTHAFRYLLDSYRTPRHAYSALTGLRTRSHFGRPDLRRILEDFHLDLCKDSAVPRGAKVGVFFCGAPTIATILDDMTTELTQRAMADGSRLRYEFRMEVFN